MEKFIWSTTCKSSFQQLKHLLTNSIVLNIENLENDFLVCTDVCKEGIIKLLMQEGQVINYE